MRAQSTASLEMDILLVKEDMEKLKKEPLKGIIKIRTRNDAYLKKSLELFVENMPSGAFAEMISVPENSDYPNTTGYRIKISEEAYKQLLNAGRTGDRTGLGSRVDISISGYYL